ncbi:AAA-ATPase-like domain-containing protein, partial [Neocallimastix sp. 'constans']
MAENKLKRLTEDENQDSTAEPPNKKRKESSDLLKKFNCQYFYIDKSLLIKKFLQDESEIVCVTRPSGYGKTTNLKMLRYFFEMNYENIKENEFQNLQNKKYFENLLISKEKEDDQTYLDKYQGKYPVIYLDFSSVIIEETYEATIENFKTFISSLYEKYENINIENLTKNKKKKREKFQSGIFSISELKQSISFLCLSLNKVFNKQIILLIDNYDSPILNTVNTSFYNEFFKFYKDVFLIIFKEDKY